MKYVNGVCYSGYRAGQSPIIEIFPDEQQVLQDLLLLQDHFQALRMYDVSTHAKTVLYLIRKHRLSLKVMLGIEPKGEISNPDCPWGGLHSAVDIERNKLENWRQIDNLAAICNQYRDIVFAASIGNESTSSWHANLMNPQTLAEHAKYLKTKIIQPVTFCEGAAYWKSKCHELAKIVDFISIHSYPLWARINLDQAFAVTVNEFETTKTAYPDKEIIFTEFGWATAGNEKMDVAQVNEKNQALYLSQMEDWSRRNKVVMFVFEAFDEPWKGSSDPNEPEKHWGIYDVNRQPKRFMKNRKSNDRGNE